MAVNQRSILGLVLLLLLPIEVQAEVIELEGTVKAVEIGGCIISSIERKTARESRTLELE